MATYTSNYAWTKPGGNDQVDISVLNGNLDSQDAIMHKAFGNMAQAFSQLSTYAVGDIVLYDNDLYKCHTAVTVAGAWTGSTNWTSWTLAEGGGGGGTSDYTDLINKPSINSVELSGNKTTSDLGIDKTAVGLGNVPNVATNDQTPTFTEASTRNNIASGEKLSVILGKIQKFFNDLKTVAFSGSYTDLTNKPNAEDIMLSDGVTSVESALDGVANRFIYVTKKVQNLTLTNQWGSLYTNSLIVDISDLGLTAVPTLFAVTYNPSPATDYAAMPIISSIRSNTIQVTMARGTSATIDGTLTIVLKSNG